MAATALIKFTQGPNTDIAGRAVLGTIFSVDGSVTVTNGSPTDIDRWKIYLVNAPPGSTLELVTQGIWTLLDEGTDDTPTTTFDPDITGSYRILLQVWDISNALNQDIRNFIVPDEGGFVLAPFQKLPDPLPLPDPLAPNPSQKDNEMNVGGQPYGWMGKATSKMLHQFTKHVAKLVKSPTGGDAGKVSVATGVDAVTFQLVTNANIDAAAAIAVSKIAAGSSDDALLESGGAATWGKIANANIDAAAAIAVTKLAIGSANQVLRMVGTVPVWGLVADANVDAAAAIAVSKLAAGTNTYVLTTTGGVPVWAAPSGGGGDLNTTLGLGNDSGGLNIVMSASSVITAPNTTGVPTPVGLQGGNSTSSGNGGDVTVLTGTGAGSSGRGGDFTVTGADGVGASFGTGGDGSFTGGDGVGSFGSGGSYSITGGDSAAWSGGGISFDGGSAVSSSGGGLTAYGGWSDNGSGGSLTWEAGSSDFGAGGTVEITGGTCYETGDGGEIILDAGYGYGGTGAGNGGFIRINTGEGKTAGDIGHLWLMIGWNTVVDLGPATYTSLVALWGAGASADGWVLSYDWSSGETQWRVPSDPNAIHDNVSDEIHQVALKGSPAGADEVLIEDSAATWAKKRVPVSALGGGPARIGYGAETGIQRRQLLAPGSSAQRTPFRVLKSGNYSTSDDPVSGPIVAGDKVYCCLQQGGGSNFGSIVSMSLAGYWGTNGIVDRYDFPALADPRDLVFDGYMIWSANYDADTVTKHHPGSALALQNTVSVGNLPSFLMFDGENVIALCQSSVYKIDPSDTATSLSGLGSTLWGAVFDGQYVWVVDFTNSNIRKIDTLSAGAPTLVSTIGSGEGLPSRAFNAAFDGSYIWVAHDQSSTSPNAVSRIDVLTEAVETFTIGTVSGMNLDGQIAFDGRYLWVELEVSAGSSTFCVVDPTTGNRIGEPVSGATYRDAPQKADWEVIDEGVLLWAGVDSLGMICRSYGSSVHAPTLVATPGGQVLTGQATNVALSDGQTYFMGTGGGSSSDTGGKEIIRFSGTLTVTTTIRLTDGNSRIIHNDTNNTLTIANTSGTGTKTLAANTIAIAYVDLYTGGQPVRFASEHAE